jgi:hypothetical protein
MPTIMPSKGHYPGFKFDFRCEKEIIRTDLKEYNFGHRMQL